jgi:hypothetical protein
VTTSGVGSILFKQWSVEQLEAIQDGISAFLEAGFTAMPLYKSSSFKRIK